ncbi:MAG: hypothetical protein U0T73_13780 [Chitinophagales bacterium]
MVLMWWNAGAGAQTVATLKADSARIQIGDVLQLKMVVRTANGNTINFPKFEGDTIGKSEILSKDPIDTSKVNGDVVLSQNIAVSIYDTGTFFLPPVPVRYINAASGRDDSAMTELFEIRVSGPGIDTTKPFRPIKAPLGVPYQWREFLPYVLFGLLLLGVIAAIVAFYLYKKKQVKPAVFRPKPKEPAHVWALAALRKLEQEKVWQEDVKQYYSRLSDILRSYLEYRYDYYALESTTEEIRDEIAQLSVSMEASSKLMETLRVADFVKFAKGNPAPDEHVRSMENAKTFVEVTKQLPEEVKPEGKVAATKKKRRK